MNSKYRQNSGKARGGPCPRLPSSSDLLRVISRAESYLTTNLAQPNPATQDPGLPFLFAPDGASLRDVQQ